MIVTLDEREFIRLFNDVRPNSFSDEALGALFDYYEEIDENMEFDPIAIDCEWSEYDDIEDAVKDYNLDDEFDVERETEVIYVCLGCVLVKQF